MVYSPPWGYTSQSNSHGCPTHLRLDIDRCIIIFLMGKHIVVAKCSNSWTTCTSQNQYYDSANIDEFYDLVQLAVKVESGGQISGCNPFILSQTSASEIMCFE